MRYLLLLLVGCTIPEKDEVGPTIHIDLQSSFEDATDQSSSPQFDLDSDSQYSVMVTINTQAGTEMKDTSLSTFPVANYSATFAVPNVTIPDSDYTGDDFDDATYTRNSPIVIPASAKGQALKVHVDASDSRGLSANVIDFSISLR